MKFIDDNIRFYVTDDPSSSIINTFYEGYLQSFVLPNETEELAEFIICLELNKKGSDKKDDKLFSNFREYVAILQNIDDNRSCLIGGANFICLYHDSSSELSSPVMTVHLNYVYVLPQFRGLGHLLLAITETPPNLIKVAVSI